MRLHPRWLNQEALAVPTGVAVLPGLAVVWGKWVGVVLFVVWAQGAARRWIASLHKPAWACRSCGYDCRGIAADRCPECGAERRGGVPGRGASGREVS